MTSGVSRPLRILVIHHALLHRAFEASEVWQVMKGMLQSAQPGELTLHATNCRRVWDVTLQDGNVVLGRERPVAALARERPDVVHVHLPIPLAHLALAAFHRLRRIPVVFSPMALLTRDFARASWYRGRSTLFRRSKPLLVAVLAWLWWRIASWVLCLSDEERRQSHVPAEKALVGPWPAPETPLAAVTLANHGWPPAVEHDRGGPLALVARLDPWRKGIDRVCAWALAHAEALPRPAVVIFAPAGDAATPALQEALDRGLVAWDTEATGAALLPRLLTCRATILLSRWEAQPRALRESVLVGLPTISTPAAHFGKVVEILQLGAVVDGDDIDAVHAAFERVASQEGAAGAAEALFSPRRQGRWLLDVLADVAGGRRPADRDYYDVAARRLATSKRG